MSPAAQIMKMKAEKTCFFTFNQRSRQEIKCLKAFQLGGGGGGRDTGDIFRQNFITSHELMVARRNGPFQLVCSVCFSQFRARDGIPENCFFLSSVHVNPRAYVCIINEMSEGKFHDLGKQRIQAIKVYRQFFFWLAILKCKKESHTKRKEDHGMERKQYK